MAHPFFLLLREEEEEEDGEEEEEMEELEEASPVSTGVMRFLNSSGLNNPLSSSSFIFSRTNKSPCSSLFFQRSERRDACSVPERGGEEVGGGMEVRPAREELGLFADRW